MVVTTTIEGKGLKRQLKKTQKYCKPYLRSTQRHKISRKIHFDLVSSISVYYCLSKEKKQIFNSLSYILQELFYVDATVLVLWKSCSEWTTVMSYCQLVRLGHILKRQGVLLIITMVQLLVFQLSGLLDGRQAKKSEMIFWQHN
uniref:Uncharacterized protein n=1 Tax=Glossina austeni TaxID=7395 RepID=A0A1A9UZQ9_GLOAU